MTFTRVVIMANDVDRLGGISSFCNALSEEFARLNFDVELIGVSPAPEGHAQSVVHSPGISVTTLMPTQPPKDWTMDGSLRHRLDLKRRQRHKERFALRRTAVEKLRSKLDGWGSETVIIITQVYGMEHLLEAGYDAADPSMPRVIGQYHGSWDGATKAGRDLRRVVKSYQDIDATVFLVPEYAKSFRRSGLNNVHAIANPVTTQPSGGPIAERSKKIVALGRYDFEKSLQYLVFAWHLIHSQFPDWSVHLYGEGPERQRLQELIDDHSIPRITLEGKTDDVAGVLDDARRHVLCSQFEGLPIAIVESGLHGVPTVGFDCSDGVASLIDDGTTGTLVDPNNVKALAKAMADFMKDEAVQESMSQASIEKMQAYRPEKIMEQWLELFKYIEA